MSNHNAIRILYGQDGSMIKLSSVEMHTNSPYDTAPQRFVIELEDDCLLSETYKPGQRNQTFEVVK